MRNHNSNHDLAFNETVSLKLISGERQIKMIPILDSDLEKILTTFFDFFFSIRQTSVRFC